MAFDDADTIFEDVEFRILAALDAVSPVCCSDPLLTAGLIFFMELLGDANVVTDANVAKQCDNRSVWLWLHGVNLLSWQVVDPFDCHVFSPVVGGLRATKDQCHREIEGH